MSDMPDWLDEVVREVRLHAEAALVRRLDAGAGFADPRVASQIYLRDAAALARIAGGTLRPQGTHRRAAEELARALAEASTSDGPRLRLAVLADRLGLDVTARALLAAAIAYALDLDTRELVHALAARRKPALYLETCADVLQLSPAALLAAIAPGAALHAGHALVVDGDGLDATLAISAPLLAWLLGREELQPPLAGACQLVAATVELGVALPPQVVAQLDQLAPRVRGSEPIAIVLRGPRGSGRRAAAHHLARVLGRPLLAISIPALLAAEQRGRTTLLGAALAAARLRDAVPFLADADALYDESGTMAAAHAEAIAAAPGLLVAASTGRGGHLELRRPALAVAMPRAELDDRRAAWEHALALRDAPATHAGELAARYVIGPGAIADVVREADRFARAAGMPLELEALEAAVSRRLSLRLGTFGTVVSRKALMSELVLPDEVIDTLRDMIAMVRERAQILERWGYQRHLGISRGVAALYSGERPSSSLIAAGRTTSGSGCGCAACG